VPSADPDRNAVPASVVTAPVASATITAAIANADTPAQVATKLVTAIMAGPYPVTAAVNGSDTSQGHRWR
jgi:phage tail sheath gpL-like